MQAVNEVRNSYEALLKDATIVKVLKKETLDQITMRVFFLTGIDDNKDIYEADIQINPISGVHEVLEFSKVSSPEPASDLKIGADIAYGYVSLPDFSTNQNVDFITKYLAEHYSFVGSSALESVEIMNLCGGKANYKLFFKNNLEMVKFIVFFEESYKRILQIRSFSFDIGGTYTTESPDMLLKDPYFRDLDKYLKEKHSEIR